MTSDLFERVRAIPIESVIREYFPNLELKHSARDLIAICPFHDEKTASFKIDTEKNRWHCFGACAKGGSVIDLLLMGEFASSPLDSAKAIALKFGIDTGEQRPKRTARAPTITQYAAFCALPKNFLLETFSLADSEAGVEIPYKDETGAVLSVQRRHRLEKAKTKDSRFTWRKGDKLIPYGLWRLPEEKTRLVIVEGASDVHVLSYCGFVSLGIPGASNFKAAMVSALLPFAELVLIQEPGAAGEKFIESIKSALKESSYHGTVRAVSLPEKDPRALWLASKDKAQFTAALEKAILAAVPIELYPLIPVTRDLIDCLEALFRRHIIFKDKDFALLLALWTLGTYVFRQFSHYGYLHIVSPVMRCAKTLLLDILAEVVANSTGRTSNLTESVVFHLAHKGRTFLVDELENMRKQDREKYGAVLAVLNAGFQAGAKVYRMKRTEEGFVEQEFDAYCPKAMAGISALSETLSDRCFQIPMTRKSATEKVDRFSLRRQRKDCEALRARLKLWASEREKDIAKLYDGIDQIVDDKLRSGLDDRFLDISEPILSIALYADIEHANGGGHVTDRLSNLLLRMAGAKGQDAEDSALATIVQLLNIALGRGSKIFISSAELLEKVQPELSWIDSKKKLANFLRRFDLVSDRDPSRTIRGYAITREWIDDIKNRYLGSLPGFETSETSQTHAQSGSEGIL